MEAGGGEGGGVPAAAAAEIDDFTASVVIESLDDFGEAGERLEEDGAFSSVDFFPLVD